MKLIRDRKTNTASSHLYVESKKAELREQRVEWWLPGVEGGENGGHIGQRVQTSHFKVNKVWGFNVHHGIIVNNTVYMYT